MRRGARKFDVLSRDPDFGGILQLHANVDIGILAIADLVETSISLGIFKRNPDSRRHL